MQGFGGGDVVAPAFGDAQVAGVFDGRDDGSADGGQVHRPAAGAVGRGIFAESHVADVAARLDRPVLADQAGQVPARWRALVKPATAKTVSREVLPAVVSCRRRETSMAWPAPGEVQAADVGALQGPGSRRPWPASRVRPPAGACRQGRALTWACSSGWLRLDHRDARAFFSPAEPTQVRLDRREGVDGHHGAGQVEGLQELGESADLALDVDLKVVQQAPAVLGGAEEVDRAPLARRAPRAVSPSMATARSRSRASVCAGRAARRARSRARWPLGAPGAPASRAEQSPGQGRGPSRSRATRIVFSSRCPVPAGQRVPWRAQPGQAAWPARLIDCPTAVTGHPRWR